jgi:glutamyl/glutaminyl-tRNA synthetase
MKRFLFSLFFVILAIPAFCRANVQGNSEDSISISAIEQTVRNVPFKLYGTGYNFDWLKLDTRNGRVWRIYTRAFLLTKSSEFLEKEVNSAPLVGKEEEKIGRFVLVKEKGSSVFVLLDSYSGNTWMLFVDNNKVYFNPLKSSSSEK